MKRYKLPGIALSALAALTTMVMIGTPSATALPSDRQQPIQVTADGAVQEGERVTYTGDVVIVQGSLRIEADRVVVHNQDRKVQRMVATGDRARLQQLPEPDGVLVKARARTITYLQAQDLIVLETDAEVEQEGSLVTGQRIEYLVATQTVRAQGDAGPGGSGRVQMVLQPESEPQPERSPPEPQASPPERTTPPAPEPATPQS